MKLHGDTGKSLSEYLGISTSRFSLKLNEKDGAEFTKGEMTKIIEKYNLNEMQIFDIFFEHNVSF